MTLRSSDVVSRGHCSCSGASQSNPNRVGVVNCQASASDYEKFYFHTDPNNNVAIESTKFPGVFLRLDASTGGEALGLLVIL